MSTITQLPLDAPALPPPGDPFYYGWRYVSRAHPDGESEYERVPLTFEDVLHPEEGDHVVEGDLHGLICAYLASVGRRMLKGDPTALVLSNTGVYWPPPYGLHHAPDVAVILGVKQQRELWTSFSVVKEGVAPRLLMEVVSPHCRKADVVDKFKHYHERQVPIYVIVDREGWDGPVHLLGYQYTPKKYLPMPTDEDGRLWLEPMGVWLAPKGNRVACFRGDTGEELLDVDTLQEAYTEIKAVAAAEQHRADAEKQRADDATARLQAMEAELQRLRQQPPAQPE